MMMALALLAAPTAPAKDLSLHLLKAPGIGVKYVDYHWQPELFAALEKGAPGGAAQRSWVVGRMLTEGKTLMLGDVAIKPGNYALVLWPASAPGEEMAFEIRRVDMRDVFLDMNVMGPAPKGETVYKAATRMEKGAPVVERFTMGLTDADGVVTITADYGDRRGGMVLKR